MAISGLSYDNCTFSWASPSGSGQLSAIIPQMYGLTTSSVLIKHKRASELSKRRGGGGRGRGAESQITGKCNTNNLATSKTLFFSLQW